MEIYSITFAASAFVLALIPAFLGRSKGYPLHTWYLYGLLMPILIPILHAVFIRPEVEGKPTTVYGRIVRKPLWMLMACVALWGILIGVFLYLASLGGGSALAENKFEQDQKALEQKASPLATFELKEFMSNTADEDTTHFVRMKMSIGYERNNLLLQTELSEKRMQIFDLIMLTLNGKKKNDLDTAQKKQDLKDELIKKINALLTNGKIDDIYYKEFSVN